MDGSGDQTAAPCSAPERLRPVLVPLVFLGLAGVLWTAPRQAASPVPAPVSVPAWATDVTPIRRAKLRPEIQVAGYTYACSDCHNLFPSPPETTRSLTQHRDITLEHGINNRCFNCHHLTNRDAFTDDWGREIPFDQPPSVCAKCHGPVYHDWLHGSHGRTNGYWDVKAGPQERRKCIECHDPHQPAFPSLKPAPGPNTLRMGPQAPAERHGAENPLRYRGLHSTIQQPPPAQASPALGPPGDHRGEPPLSGRASGKRGAKSEKGVNGGECVKGEEIVAAREDIHEARARMP